MILSYIALPALTLAFSMVGIIARITRSAIIDVAQEEFITTAVAKGLTRNAIVRRHLLPNAAVPIITIIGLELGVLISGSIIVEVVFSWPGLGTLLYQAISVRDIPLTTGIVVSYTTLFIVINVIIDIVYFLIDPAHPRHAGRMKSGMRTFLNAKFIVGAVCLGLVLFIAAFGDFITPHAALDQDLLNSLQPPRIDAEHYYLGTDHLGRDILARMVSGARVSLLIAASIVLISGVFGVLYGALSGYWGGIARHCAAEGCRNLLGVPPDPACARDPRLLRPEPDQHHPGAFDPALDSLLPHRARSGAGPAEQGIRRSLAGHGWRHDVGRFAPHPANLIAAAIVIATFSTQFLDPKRF